MNESTEYISDSIIISLQDLLFEDVVIPFILNRLSSKELFILRNVNREWKELISDYFKKLTAIDLEGVTSRSALNIILDAKLKENKNNELATISCDGKCYCCCNRIKSDQVLLPKIKSHCGAKETISTPCPLYTNHTLLHDSSHRYRLRKLNFRRCKWLTDQDLLRVLHNDASTLQLLDISSCFQVLSISCFLVSKCSY